MIKQNGNGKSGAKIAGMTARVSCFPDGMSAGNVAMVTPRNQVLGRNMFKEVIQVKKVVSVLLAAGIITLCTFLLFCVPAGSITMQYVYFFIVYTSLNAVFFTANGIAYSALSALITRNANERVQLGSIRFMFALFTGILVPSITMGLVESFGGGAAGWRTVALIYSVLALIINTISCLSVK